MDMQKKHNFHEQALRSSFNTEVESFSPKLAVNIFEISSLSINIFLNFTTFMNLKPVGLFHFSLVFFFTH